MSAELIARLIEAGTPAALVAEVAMLAARAEASSAGDPVAERRRAWDRQYRAEKRAEAKMSGGSGGCRVDNADKVDIVLSPSLSPPDPQTPIPIPVGDISRARDELPFLLRVAIAQAMLAAVIEDCLGRRWKGMPPPAGVTPTQWRGFLDMRKAKREALTPRAYTLITGKLTRLAEDGWPPGDLVDLAVERNWSTVFPPKNEIPPNAERSRQGRDPRERYADRMRDPVLDDLARGHDP